jgi:hypothetical protein
MNATTGTDTRTSPDRNVVLIILDTVRKDYFDLYATRLREQSAVTFDQCRAASSWSVPSHASIFTGELPHVHRIHGDSFDAGKTYADLRDRTFWALMSRRTVGLSANAYVNTAFGSENIFDETRDFVAHASLFPSGLSPYEFGEQFDGSKWEERAGLIRACLAHDYPGRSLANAVWNAVDIDTSSKPVPGMTDDGAKAITDAAVKRAGGEEPFFMFLNYMDAHTPLRPLVQYDSALHSVPNTWSSEALHNWEINKDGKGTPEYFRNYRALYGAAIDYLDRTVATLVRRVEEQTDQETTYVLTADHGNNLGYPADDGLIHHTGSMSEGILHVPLEIINPPESYPERVDGLFSHLALGDLIGRLASGEPWDDSLTADEIPAEHISLSGTGDPRNYRDFEPGEFAYWDRLVRCVYRDGEKFEWDSLGEQSRYRLDSARPCWQKSVEEPFDVESIENSHFQTRAQEYKEQVSAEAGQTQSVDAGVEERLRQLGYR